MSLPTTHVYAHVHTHARTHVRTRAFRRNCTRRIDHGPFAVNTRTRSPKRGVLLPRRGGRSLASARRPVLPACVLLVSLGLHDGLIARSLQPKAPSSVRRCISRPASQPPLTWTVPAASLSPWCGHSWRIDRTSPAFLKITDHFSFGGSPRVSSRTGGGYAFCITRTGDAGRVLGCPVGSMRSGTPHF